MQDVSGMQPAPRRRVRKNSGDVGAQTRWRTFAPHFNGRDREASRVGLASLSLRCPHGFSSGSKSFFKDQIKKIKKKIKISEQ
jgi:hypothetical protein